MKANQNRALERTPMRGFDTVYTISILSLFLRIFFMNEVSQLTNLPAYMAALFIFFHNQLIVDLLFQLGNMRNDTD